MKKQILLLLLALALLPYAALAAADGTYTWPMSTDKDITTHYTDDLTGMTHGALDFLAPLGSPVYAAADGVVTEVRDEACLGSHFQGTTPANPCPLGGACQAVVRQGASGGYGNYVVISHGNGVTVLYGQLQSGSIHLEAGQTVSRGEQIALSGVSGNAYRPHLHFEMRRDGNTVDPEPLLTRVKPDPVSHSPVMALESLSSPAPGQFRVTGWAYDPDDLSAAVSVHVYIGNTGASNSTGTLIGTITADEYRQDVDARHHCGAYHGFSATFSTSLSGACAVRAEAVNLGGTGGNIWTDSPLFVTIESTADTEKPVISGPVRVEYLSPKGYTVTVPAADNVGVASVRMPSWVGSDSASAEWYNAVRFGSEWSYAIDRDGEKEVWHTDVRVYDEAGNQAPLISIYIRYLTLTLDAAGGALPDSASAETARMPVFNAFYLTDYRDQKYIGLYGDLPEPVRSGYLFDGWYTASSGGSRVTASTRVSAESDHTLYAHWVRSDQSAPEIRGVTISGVSLSGYTVTVEAVDDIGVTRVRMPSWVGSYTSAVPWHEARQSANAWSASISRAGESGVWHTEAHVYDDAGNEAPLVSVYLRQLSVSFNPNGGSTSVLSKTVFNAFYLIDYRSQTYCAAYGELPVPERPGYAFDGWYTALSGGSRVTEDTLVRSESNHTLYARWRAGSSGQPTPVQPTPGQPTPGQPTPGQPTPSPAPEDDGTARIVVGGAAARPGGSAQVTISLRNNPGVVSMMLRLSYDRSALTLTNVEDGRLLGQYEGSRSDYGAMPYVLSWSDDTATVNRTANGAIATLTFAVSARAAEKEYPVQISYDNSRDEIFNAAFQTVSFAVTQGAVRVSSGTAGDVNRDGHVTAIDRTVLARHLAGWSDYAAAAIDTSAADVNADGRVTAMDRTVLARHLAGWSGYETLPYTTGGGVLSFAMPGGAAFLNAGNTPRIRVGSAAVGAGETAAVAISLENNPGVISMDLLADYPDALELVRVEDGGLFGDNTHNPDYSQNPYILSWNDDLDRENYSGNGTLATLYFRLKEGARPGTYAVGVHYNREQDAIFNNEWQAVEFAVSGGSVRFGDSAAEAGSPAVSAPVFSGNGDSMRISMRVSGAPAGSALACAVYDGAGRLVSYTSRAVQGDGDYAFPLPGADAARVKGFLVDKGGKPLCVAAKSA